MIEYYEECLAGRGIDKNNKGDIFAAEYALHMLQCYLILYDYKNMDNNKEYIDYKYAYIDEYINEKYFTWKSYHEFYKDTPCDGHEKYDKYL